MHSEEQKQIVAGKWLSLRLRTKMLLLFGGGTAVVLLIIGFVDMFGIPRTTIEGQYTRNRDSVLANMQNIADQQQTVLALWFNERIGDLKVFSELAPVQDVARVSSRVVRSRKSIAADSPDAVRSSLMSLPRIRQVMAQMASLRAAYNQYDSVELVDIESGLIAVAADPVRIGTRHPFADQLPPQAGAASDQKILFVTMPGDEKPSLLLSMTVQPADDSRPEAVAVFTISMDTFSQHALSAENMLGSTGEIVLIDMMKTLLTPLKHPLPDGTIAAPLKHRMTTTPAEFAGWGVDTMVEADDYRGIPVVSFVRHLRVTPEFAIGLIVKRDRQDLFAPVHKSLAISVIISSIGIAAIIILVVFVARQLGRPLERLSRAAHQISSGDLDTRITDINGIEAGTLAQAFNFMAESVQRSHTDLEHQVAARTEELQSLSARQEAILTAVPDIIMEVDVNRVYTWANGAGQEFFGDDVIGRQAAFYFAGEQDTYQKTEPLIEGSADVLYVESWQRRRDGQVRLLAWWCKALRDEQGKVTGGLSTARDITEFKKAEEEKLKLESQLQQAQKMESVGRLAGGVAHDFNNMLGVILGHAELGLMRLDPTHRVCADLKEISKTAERSADLTRQLLAFARKQTVMPKVIDLNDTVTNMLKMLQRLIGEDIQLVWQPSPHQCQVKMDPSQIDQILANLCVNARDAIEDTGRVSIETGTCTIDADYCASNPEATPGEYVRLVVSDSGKGMDRETQSHIFEPFYTTKELGKGTGLGLATVYGAVKQNNGFVNIYSEPGKGTTFTIHLPREANMDMASRADTDAETAVPRGQETILLVEDEPAILDITSQLLEMQDYTVLRADTPGRAMELAREHQGTIHLLMTDVIMPEMNGKDLAENILTLHPGMKRLFMSGYTADVIAHHGVLDEGVHFIQKPFSLPNMAAMVREVLDGNS